MIPAMRPGVAAFMLISAIDTANSPTCSSRSTAFAQLGLSSWNSTSCNFAAPIATLDALSNPREVLLHPNCTQIFSILSLSLDCTFDSSSPADVRRSLITGKTKLFPKDQAVAGNQNL